MSKKDKKYKKEDLTAQSKRELEVLSHYYEINHETKIAKIPFHFEKASDIIVDCIGTKEHPVIESEILENISNVIHSFPDDYNVSYSIKIDNYEGYNPECLMNSIQDSLEIFNFNVKKQKAQNSVKMSLLLVAGIVVFAWLFYICSLKIFGDEEVTHNIVHEVVYTVACVLLWEGIYILFLPDSNYQDVSASILVRLNSVELLDKKGKILASRTIDEFKKDWVHETRRDKRFKKAFLISATGFLCLSLSGIPEIITMAKNIPNNSFNIVAVIITSAFLVFFILTGLSNLSFFYGRGPFKKCIIPFNAIALAFVTCDGIIHIYNSLVNKQSSIFWSIIIAMLFVVALIGLTGAIVLSKKNKEINNQ